MASMQEKVERAEEAARKAASELSDLNRERNREYEEGNNRDRPQHYDQEKQEERTGVIGSILKSVTETLGQAKESVTGPTDESREERREDEGGKPPSEKAREVKDRAAEKVTEVKDRAGENVEEVKDRVAEAATGKTQSPREYEEGNNRDRDCDRTERYDEGKEGERPGVIGSILKSVTETLGQAKEAVTGPGREDWEEERREGKGEKPATEKVREVKDRAAEKAEEMKNAAAEKAERAKETVKGKAEESKEHTRETKGMAAEKTNTAKEKAEETKEKAGEFKDYTAEKTKEGKDTVVGKIEELKETAAEKARRAMEMLASKRDDEAKDEDEARRSMEGLKLKDMDFHDVTDPDAVVEVALVDVDDTWAGKAASTFKAADQMTGQTFNDVGNLDEEGRGVVVVERDASGGVVRVGRLDPRDIK